MDFVNLFETYSTISIAVIIIFSFIAGFIDAVVGGGGLIQFPALLINFPNTSPLILMGSNKIGSLAGTSVAAVSYSRKVKFDFRVLITFALFAGLFSYLGAKVVEYIPVSALKPLILVILIAIAIFTFIKKDLGANHTKNLSLKKQLMYGSLLSIIIGFYDGFFGPGTGSFFVLGFVVVLGYTFLQASAYTKIVNCMTNITALMVFIRDGNFILEIAILLAVFNMTGNFVGSRLAIKKGNGFIRVIFLVIVLIMIGRYGYDIFIK